MSDDLSELIEMVVRIHREVKDEYFAARLIVELIPKQIGRMGGRPPKRGGQVAPDARDAVAAETQPANTAETRTENPFATPSEGDSKALLGPFPEGGGGVSVSGSSLSLFPASGRISQRSELVVRQCDEPSPQGFDEWWAMYPAKGRVAKAKCKRLWRRIKPPLDVVMVSLVWHIESQRWQEGYIPHAHTWLNEARWEVERTPHHQGNGNGYSKRDLKFLEGSQEFIRRKQQQEASRDGK